MRITAILIGTLLFTAQHGHAQSADTFEVVSVRRNLSGNQQGSGLAGVQPGGRFIAIGATLRRLVTDAYDGVQVAGGPDWIDTARFDIDARAAGDRSLEQIRRMLRSLLAARFMLAARIEAREMPIYQLIAARDDRRLGPQLRATDAACAQEARNFLPGAPATAVACGDFRMSARALTARGMTMATLARLLSGNVDRPVIDRTDLQATYDLQLEWSSDLGLRPAPPGSAGAGDLSPDGVSLFTALQEQLGLRLQATRGPVDVIVIDRAELPDSN